MLHDLKLLLKCYTFLLRSFIRLNMINKQAYNVKEPRHPADNKNDMDCLEVEIRHKVESRKLKAKSQFVNYIIDKLITKILKIYSIIIVPAPQKSDLRLHTSDLVPKLLNNLHCILHIIKRNIRHNSMTKVENKAIFTAHALE